MKKLILIFTFLGVNFLGFSQDVLNDANRIILNVHIPEIEGLTSSSERVLVNKLRQICTKNGLAGEGYEQRYVIAPDIAVLSKDITPTAPPMIAYTLEVTLYIGDAVNGTIFFSYTKELKGVGKNETKAYLAALKRINPSSLEIKEFIEKGKKGIIDYYNTQCESILSEANVMSQRKEFEKALDLLLTIPNVCEECYKKSQSLSVEIYKAQMDEECVEFIQAAKEAKTNSDWDLASQYLYLILPDTKCYDEAQELIKEIEGNICYVAVSKAKAAWAIHDLEGTNYWLSKVSPDSKCQKEANSLLEEIKTHKEKEWELILQQQKDKTELNKQTIKSLKEIELKKTEQKPKTKKMEALE